MYGMSRATENGTYMDKLREDMERINTDEFKVEAAAFGKAFNTKVETVVIDGVEYYV